MNDFIHIKGARIHNLKNIEVCIPRSELVVITGPSGSGKSSLAFDTLFAEGQRRYVESLSAYARQFLEKMPKPQVDLITGISPAIAIQQKAPSGNPRSTIGTITEIYDYLRLLFARIGDIFCPRCGSAVAPSSPAKVWDHIQELPDNTRFYLSFPVAADLQNDPDRLSEWLLQQGIMRVWQNGQIIHLQKEGSRLKKGEAEGIVDRIVKTDQLVRNRAIESIETAFQLGEGFMNLISPEGRFTRFNQQLVCSSCGAVLAEPQPRLFSFNNPFGACPGCQGFGDMFDIDMNKVVPDPSKSLRQGAVVPWNTPSHRHMLTKLAYIAPRYNIPMETPYRDLTDEQKDVIINGRGNFPGVRGFFKRLESKKYKIQVRVFISRYRSYFTCTECSGRRLKPEALAVKVGGRNISELVRLPISGLAGFFRTLHLTEEKRTIARQLLEEISKRLQFLLDVGLDYPHLDRRAGTLSGGEFQRINLATALGTALTGTLFVLDEPTIGLHPRDTGRLIHILQSLVRSGNTVVVVEHDREVMESARHIIDLGPASGARGGELMFSGDYAALLQEKNNLTAAYLSGEKSVQIKRGRRKPSGGSIIIKGAAVHNLKNIDVEIPLNRLVLLTGVSGSGKSTLMKDVLYNGYQHQQGRREGKAKGYTELQGLARLQRMELVDQSPIGRTPRSNPITYIKGFDEIRKLFAASPLAKAHGYRPGHFSFNVPGGRCEVCKGDGQIKIEMQFLADVYMECEACRGKRFKPEILDVAYRGKNIYQVLEMSADEAAEFFADQSKILRSLKVLQSVGLGYLHLGQPATTLSGGEAQRIKLAANLNRKSHKEVLFLFDEPTTGLHFSDIARLLTAFNELIERGASLLVIEHNLEVIRFADWIIDLGPEGGMNGGEVVAAGTPQQLAESPGSCTGKFLKKVLNNVSSI
ncbi:MAG: excinuclease ABC subunit UvrA [Calditrichia bacterium]